MYKYIGIEDLVANALIELMKKDVEHNRVSLRTLSEYGAVVVKFLAKDGSNAILLLTKDTTYGYIRDYSEYYRIETVDGEEYIVTDATIETLRMIRGNFTVDLAEALTQEESLNVLLCAK